MKKRNEKSVVRTVSFILLIVLSASLLFSCGNDQTAESTDAASGGLLGDPGSPDISEKAIGNFLEKLEEGNYTAECTGGLIKANVCSKDLVYFNFFIGDGEDSYDGIALMTINEKETFSAYLGEDGMKFISFVDEGKAIDVARTGEKIREFKLKLPSCIIEAANGNIWDVFYNDVDDPLRFVTNDDTVKSLVQIYAGIGDVAMPRMQEVYLELNAEDPTEAHFRTSFTPGYPTIEDVDLVISFGGAEPDARAEAWMNDENREYPAVKTGWDETDLMNLNAIYLPGYGESALPFPDFATYALNIDISRILKDNVITVRDCRATPEDMEEYAEKLESAGFEAASDDSGLNCYRKLLRDEYKCYSSVYLEYDEGVTVLGTVYYDFPTYEGADAVNEKISAEGYPELPADDSLSDFTAVDRASETTESWLYFFDYGTVLFVTVRFEDQTKAEDYVKAYIDLLEGFVPDKTDGEEEYDDEYDEVAAYLGGDSEDLLRFSYLEDEDLYYRLKTAEGTKAFKYIFNDDGETFSLLFKTEKYVPADNVREAVTKAGFPEIDLSAFDTCRDHKKFEKVMYGKDLDLGLSLSLSFETPADAEALLDDYIKALKDDFDFDITNPASINMSTSSAYSKEIDGKLAAFGFDYVQGSEIVNVKFRVSDPPEEE